MLVELAGPAGAGKTTLLRELVARERPSCAGLAPRSLRDAPHAVGAACSSLAALAELAMHGPTPRREHARHLVRLGALRARVRAASRAHAIVLLDEGPVYSLARLHAAGACGAAGSALERGWRRALSYWRGALDTIVWIDAPNGVLADRIRSRRKPHRAKHAPDAQLVGFLDGYRRAYGVVLAQLTAPGGTRLVVLPAEGEPVRSRADRLLDALGAPLA